MKMISVYLFDNLSSLEELVNAIKKSFKLRIKCNKDLFAICSNGTDEVTVNISKSRVDFFITGFNNEDYNDLSEIINYLITKDLIRCEGYYVEEYGKNINESNLVLN